MRPRRVPEVQVRILNAEDPASVLDSYLSVQRRGFAADDEPPTAEYPVLPPETVRLRRQLRDGQMRCAIASWQKTPAGAGCITPFEGIGELAGVATLPALRRRGVAATLSSALVEDHFDRGGTLVWLSAADAVAQGVYTRIGFRLLDSRLNYIDRNPGTRL